MDDRLRQVEKAVAIYEYQIREIKEQVGKLTDRFDVSDRAAVDKLSSIITRLKRIEEDITVTKSELEEARNEKRSGRLLGIFPAWFFDAASTPGKILAYTAMILVTLLAIAMAIKIAPDILKLLVGAQ